MVFNSVDNEITSFWWILICDKKLFVFVDKFSKKKFSALLTIVHMLCYFHYIITP